MTRVLKLLGVDERGASVIELALAAPIIAALIVGMTDVARACSMKLRLEQSAQRAIEKIQQQGRNSNDYTALSAVATAEATSAGYPANTVTVRYNLICNGSESAHTTGAAINAVCNSGETYFRYVTVSISSDFTPVFGSKYFPHANANGSLPLTGYAGLRVQ